LGASTPIAINNPGFDRIAFFCLLPFFSMNFCQE